MLIMAVESLSILMGSCMQTWRFPSHYNAAGYIALLSLSPF